MPGFELFGNAERKEVNDVLDNGVMALMVCVKGTGKPKH